VRLPFASHKASNKARSDGAAPTLPSRQSQAQRRGQLKRLFVGLVSFGLEGLGASAHCRIWPDSAAMAAFIRRPTTSRSLRQGLARPVVAPPWLWPTALPQLLPRPSPPSFIPVRAAVGSAGLCPGKAWMQASGRQNQPLGAQHLRGARMAIALGAGNGRLVMVEAFGVRGSRQRRAHSAADKTVFQTGQRVQNPSPPPRWPALVDRSSWPGSKPMVELLTETSASRTPTPAAVGERPRPA